MWWKIYFFSIVLINIMLNANLGGRRGGRGGGGEGNPLQVIFHNKAETVKSGILQVLVTLY